jgi:hypothetical protein
MRFAFFKSLSLSLVPVENASFLWFNVMVLRLYAPLVLLILK